MTSSFVPPRLAAEVTSLLSQLGVAEAAWRGGTLAVRSPINGEAIGQVVESRPVDVSQGIADAHRACLAWRTVPAPRRGELVRLLGEELRLHKGALGRLVTIEVGKVTSEGLGEVQEMIDICDFAVGLSRQLYGLTIATERADHRMMETWHPLGVVGVISAFNFPVAVWSWNAALALVCGNAVRLEAVGEDAADGAGRAGLVRARRERVSASRRRPGLSAVLIGGARGGRGAGGRPARGARLGHRLHRAWAVPSARAWRRALPARSWSSAATMPPSWHPRPTWTWRCAPSPSRPWAPPASAARRCAGCSSTRASTTRCVPRLKRPTARWPSAIR